MTTREQVEPGDVFAIETADGPLYVQVTHRHRASSEVVRVLPAPAGGGAPDLDALARQDALLVAMVPLAGAIGSGRLPGRRLGNATVPEAARRFPTFRMAIRDKKDGVRGEVAYWWFWDGDGLTYDADPPAGSEGLPMREVLSVDDFLRRAGDAAAAAR